MSDKEKLCDWKKEKLESRFDAFRKIVLNPSYACRKCGRVAVSEEWLCKPISLTGKTRSPA